MRYFIALLVFIVYWAMFTATFWLLTYLGMPLGWAIVTAALIFSLCLPTLRFSEEGKP